jgi:hypothetical protein
MLSSKTSVKLSKPRCDRARAHAGKAGYSSLEEFIQHVLEREMAKLEEATSRYEVEANLKGLGNLK